MAAFAIYARSLIPQLAAAHAWVFQVPVLGWMLQKYMAVAFAAWTLGVCLFVVSLRKRRLYRYQFSQFAYCHMALFMVVWQSGLVVTSLLQGLIFAVLPITMVVCNDVWAYVFGFFFGKTPLIRLSPKKTWEGFIGAWFATIIWGVCFCWVLERVDWAGLNSLMLCPAETLSVFEPLPSCDVNTVHAAVHAPVAVADWWFGRYLPAAAQDWTVSNMQVHSVVLACCASIVAPFGGFFASGFKRAFKIKDFGDVIPGHGGLTDRMDCQVVMGGLVYVYCWHFLGLDSASSLIPTVASVAAAAKTLNVTDQAALLQHLAARLGMQVVPSLPGSAPLPPAAAAAAV